MDEHGRCWIADVIERDDASGLPQKWKCTAECKLLTDDEVMSILKAKDFFKLPMAELRRELKNVDSGCENGHYTAACPDMFPSGEDVPCSQLLGHPLACASGNCHSLLRILRAASTHYPVLRRFLFLLYRARHHHGVVHEIDTSLRATDYKRLMQLVGMKENFSDLFTGAL